MNIFQGIIDIYDGNGQIDLRDTWQRGVRAILHETSMGLYKKDRAYATRKAEALEMGFLWAGYHLVSAGDIGAQLDVLLEMEDGSDPRVGLAIALSGSGKQVYLFALAAAKVPLPLGWMLSNEAAQAMQQELYDGDLSKCSPPIWNGAMRDQILASLRGR
jgi:hypothetical protein